MNDNIKYNVYLILFFKCAHWIMVDPIKSIKKMQLNNKYLPYINYLNQQN